LLLPDVPTDECLLIDDALLFIVDALLLLIVAVFMLAGSVLLRIVEVLFDIEPVLRLTASRCVPNVSFLRISVPLPTVNPGRLSLTVVLRLPLSNPVVRFCITVLVALSFFTVPVVRLPPNPCVRPVVALPGVAVALFSPCLAVTCVRLFFPGLLSLW